MEMKADVFRLDETVQTMHEDTSSALIPDGIERLVDERPSRLAVDPRAMAASCALLAGYQARATGQPQLAAEMFAHIVSHYPVERYRYYVVQAYYGLKQIEGGERFLPKQPLPLCSRAGILGSPHILHFRNQQPQGPYINKRAQSCFCLFFTEVARLSGPHPSGGRGCP